MKTILAPPKSTYRTLRLIALVSSFSLYPSTLFAQGSLTPPGAPAPTMKTLDQVEPRTPIDATHTPGDADSLFKITQPGSYYLTANVTGVNAKYGVEIAASGVTLDLNGFDLVGVPGSLDGVAVTPLNAVNINVRNGSVRSWGGYGINLLDAATSATNVADIVASQNAGGGISMGFGGTITRCTCYNNTGSGIAGASRDRHHGMRIEHQRQSRHHDRLWVHHQPKHRPQQSGRRHQLLQPVPGPQ